MNILDRIKIYNQLMEEKKKKEKEEAKKRLKRDKEGKPIIKLTPLEETVVNTKTQEDYNTLMQVYECGGWGWDGRLPTSENYWDYHKEKTCLRVRNVLGISPTDYYQEITCKVLSTKEFYKKQKITKEMINEIKDYFENKK